ncbi:ogr/Delta-like zinc finger family protein [Gemmatimonadota bacterium]
MGDFPRTCPHCDTRLKKWRVPDEASWEEEFFYICFNDDCSYYVNGWKWMKEQFQQNASYRFTVNPTTGCSSMIPVWSSTATREMIVEDDEEGGDAGGDEDE